MQNNHFTPYHINATSDDLSGNNGIGRYILLPGSDGRAKEISQHFDNLTVKESPRGHNLYLGTLQCDATHIDVAAIASGMGCASVEIILHELFHLGAKRFLRVGTAGSLQPDLVKIGDLVNVIASVRDEGTTTDYFPIEIPAVSSFEISLPIMHTAKKMGLADKLHTGTVHCKSSLYAREFGAGPKGEENLKYIDLLNQCGILASEMETAALFIQTQLYNHLLSKQGKDLTHRVLAGAILAIIAIPPHQFMAESTQLVTIANLIELGLETIRVLARTEIIAVTGTSKQTPVFAGMTDL